VEKILDEGGGRKPPRLSSEEKKSKKGGKRQFITMHTLGELAEYLQLLRRGSGGGRGAVHEEN